METDKLTSDIEDGRADKDDLWLSGYGWQENPPEAKWRLEHVDGDKFTLDNFNYDLSSMYGGYFKLVTDNGSVDVSTYVMQRNIHPV